MGIFVNYSNHLSTNWDAKQIEAAQLFGRIVDIAFPAVDPNANEEDIEQLADDAVGKILCLDEPVAAVMVQGEYALTYAVVDRLISHGITVLTACTERNVTEHVDAAGNRVRESAFRFVRFREYRRMEPVDKE